MWPPPKLIASLLTWRGWNPRVIRAGSRLHTALLRRFGSARLIGGDALLLTTRGWRTGRETSTPLFCAADGARLLVAASFAGSGTLPVWYRNLVAHPEVKATVGGRTAAYRARTLTAAEAEAVWPKLMAVYPTFVRYLRRARRPIPLVELSPIRPADAPVAAPLLAP
jgi:deazaflavin-dependent oxidoreductase (nitroreductase family)